MSREKLAVAGGWIISWIVAAKTIVRAGDSAYMGGFFQAGWPIPIKMGLTTPTGGQIFWAGLANSWIYMAVIWLVLMLVFRRKKK
jgi:hypothetical protein